MNKSLAVPTLLERMGRLEQKLKHAGAFEQAVGVRAAIVEMLRIADELEPSLDPSEPT